MQRRSLGILLCGLWTFPWLAALPAGAAQPITITFEDINNKPFGFDQLPPFTWRGVLFSGGAVQRHPETGNTWYRAVHRNEISLKFPPGSTDISFEVDGRGQSNILFEYMPIQIWQGSIGTGTLIETLPLPVSLSATYPPKHKVEIPGPASEITMFTRFPPSGVSEFANEINLDNLRYTPPDPEPTITFNPVDAGKTRVITHNYGDYPYPSTLQPLDGMIRVEATVSVNNQPAAGKTIHFRIVDPPDTAPYVTHAGDAAFNDNFDGLGTLNDTGTPTATGVSDGNGRVSVTLHVSSFASGDNYQIEASGNANFPCGLTCAKSAVYTAWKRVHVEYNEMFRRGAYIRQDVPQGGKHIRVSNVNAFPSPPFTIRLIHAPPVNTTNSVVDVYSETITVTNVEPDGGWPLGVRAGWLALNVGVQNAYVADQGADVPVEIRPSLADAVGLVTGNRAADYFLLNSRYVKPTFEAAYVETIWLTDSVAGIDQDLQPDEPRLAFDGVLPYEPSFDDRETEWVGRKWMQHAQRIGMDRIADPNHFILFAATNHITDHGTTRVASRFNDLWLYVRQIGNSTLIAESLVHELGHEWSVNQDWQPGVPHPGIPRTYGHCNVAFGKDVKMYNREQKCTMHSTMYGDSNDSERNDGIVAFHYEHLPAGTDSEYLRIRRRLEPVPQNEKQRGPLN